MDLRSRLLSLVEPTDIGGELVTGTRLTGVSTELGLRFTFEVGDDEIHVELEPAVDGRPHAVRTAQLMFSYRVGDRRRPVDSKLGIELCQAVADRAAARERAVLAAIERDAAAAREHTEGEQRVRKVEVESLLERAGTPKERFYSLTPYVGCVVGCQFCYAQTRVGIVRRLEQLPALRWGSYVDIRYNAAEVLERELATLPVHPIKFCPIVSDPYQAVERKHRITRACLQTIASAERVFPTLVLSRCLEIVEDADLIASLPRAFAGVSVPTIDDDARRHFEPRAASIDERLRALDVLREAGVSTFAIVQPLFPGSLAGLADALARHVQSVRIDVLYGVEGAATQFADPRYSHCRDAAWQAEQASALAEALAERGVSVWPGELPPALGD